MSIPAWLTIVGLLAIVAARLVDPVPVRLRHGLRATDRPDGLRRRTTVRQRRVEGSLAAVVGLSGLILIVYGIFISTNPPDTTVIVGIQGRYFLPYGLIVLFGVRPGPTPTWSRTFHRMLIVGIIVFDVWWILRVLSWWRLLP